MTYQTILLNANAFLCLLIALRLMFFQKAGRKRRFGMSLVAYGLILAAASTTFRIWFGQYAHIDISEVIVNVFVCAAVYRARGNISEIAGRNEL